MSDARFNMLKALVCNVPRTTNRSGRELRAMLADKGHRLSGPAFYQFMARLEDAGCVSGRYVSRVIDGEACRERWYCIAPISDGLQSDVV